MPDEALSSWPQTAGYVKETEEYVVVDAEPQLPRQLEIFTMKTCRPCKRAMAWLDENRVPYRERDVDEPEHFAAAKALRAGRGVSTPLIHWDDHVISGFAEQTLERLLYPNGRQTRQKNTKREWLSHTPRDYDAMYTWFDDEGSMHIVKSLDDVPPRFRARAKKHDSY